MRKRARDWSFSRITPDLDLDCRESNSLTLSSEEAIAEEMNTISISNESFDNGDIVECLG